MDRIRMVLCDIDSTLITDDQRLTPYTKNIIDRLHDHGILFGIASGRPINEVNTKAKLWGFDYNFDILIGMNGSELWDEKAQKQYDYYKLKREWMKEIIELMEPYHSNPYIYYHDVMMCKDADENMMRSSRKNGKEVIVVKDMKEMYAEENAKIMFRIKESQMDEIEAMLEKLDAPYKGFKTQPTLIEFADKRTSKDYALKEFCKMNDIDLKDVLAFGDTSNDNSMLECAGWGVCMANGSDDTKAIADDITERTNNEDGFAYYMEEHFMKKYNW
ncbi:Cof-type HAD-IIB family hydrolase [uncultured Traorella sp.]|uniref:Cof-type HAD-IIB family hydrolase n=1 Tax=uncultured Traorella sp. TaxID=1929048 RepID=UPI0025E1DB2F|nr:Cof-type HAD-IIB family hydrolase [uncultured Traorella sp.]